MGGKKGSEIRHAACLTDVTKCYDVVSLVCLIANQETSSNRVQSMRKIDCPRGRN